MNAAILNVANFLDLSNLKLFVCLKQNVELNFLFIFICFPLGIFISLSMDILLNLIISSYPLYNEHWGIINLVSFNSSCNSHSIFVFFVSFFGILHFDFCPEAKVISKIKSSSNFNLGSGGPFMKKIPVFVELVVSIDVGINVGIFSKFSLYSSNV